MMRFSELWRISSTVYREICFQSIFSLRLGATFPRMGEAKIEKLVSQAKTSMLISKILVAIFVLILGVLPLSYRSLPIGNLKLPEELAVVSCISVYLSAVLFLLIMVGLQVTTSLVSTKAFEILGALPISRRGISVIALLSFIRIFDVPLVTAVITFPVVYFLFIGSALGSLVSLFAIVITEAFALTFTVGLAKFFYSKIAGGGGGSRYKAVLRFVYMLIWILPSFGIYIVMNFAVQIFQFLASTLTQISLLYTNLLAFVYPFSLGFLISLTTFPQKVNLSLATFSLISSFAYFALAFFGLRYVGSTVREICAGRLITSVKELVKDTFIRPKTPWLGIISKDLRVASRSPAYASILLLPIIQTAIIALIFLNRDIELGVTSIFGMLSGMSFLILMVTPILFSAETLASAYMRSLPLKRRTVIAAKVLLTVLIYLITIMTMSILAFYLGSNATLIVIYGFSHAFSVAAASITELLLLIRKFWKEEFTMGSVYTRLSTFIVTLIPGIAIVMMPIIVGGYAYFMTNNLVLPIFMVISLSEFAIAALFASMIKN